MTAGRAHSGPPGDGSIDLANLAALRGAVYRVFADLFLSPQRLAQLVAATPEVRTASEPLRSLAFFSSFERILGRLDTIDDDAFASIEREYAHLFVAGDHAHAAPPLETAYLHRGGFDAGFVLARIEDAYAREGLVPLRGQAPDHVSTEMEFMAALCHREAGESPGEAPGVEAAQRSFLREHPARWLPRFAERLAMIWPEGDYAAFATAAVAFVAHDVRFLDALLGVEAEARHGR